MLLAGLVLASSLGSGLSPNAGAWAAPLLYFEPDTLLVSSDQTQFDAFMWLNTNQDSVACYSVTMAFDTSKVVLLNAVEGDLYAQAGHETFFDWDSIAPDTSRFVDCVLGYETFVLGAGEIVRLTFEKRTTGTLITELVLMDPIATDVHRQEIPGVETRSGFLFLNPASSIEEESPFPAPARLRVSPNPAGSRVWISWDGAGHVSVGAAGDGMQSSGQARALWARVMDPTGRTVNRIAMPLIEGRYAASWAGVDEQGRAVPPGAYFIALDPPGRVPPAKVILLGPIGTERAR